jgi:AbiV family abortive infection protein
MQTPSRRAEGTWHDVTAEERVPLYDLHAACMHNAVELMEEAELLLLNKHYASAVALAITAREELGKAQIVADRLDGCVSRSEFEQAFRRHDLKAAYVSRQIELQLAPGVGNAKGARGSTITYDLQHGQKLFDLRTDSLYVGWDGSKPLAPNETVTPELAEQAVASVKSSIEHEMTMQYLTDRIGTRSQYR